MGNSNNSSKTKCGYWEEYIWGFTIYQKCSECGAERPRCDYFPTYCPNCGARMDGEDEDE